MSYCQIFYLNFRFPIKVKQIERLEILEIGRLLEEMNFYKNYFKIIVWGKMVTVEKPKALPTGSQLWQYSKLLLLYNVWFKMEKEFQLKFLKYCYNFKILKFCFTKIFIRSASFPPPSFTHKFIFLATLFPTLSWGLKCINNNKVLTIYRWNLVFLNITRGCVYLFIPPPPNYTIFFGEYPKVLVPLNITSNIIYHGNRCINAQNYSTGLLELPVVWLRRELLSLLQD